MVPVISLTTDFGLSDGYVGTMHGVILRICPEARIVDLTHGIAAQNVRQAAFVLGAAYRYFPNGTVHVVVVDPGVGSARRAVAVQTADAYFVAPDNGVLSEILVKEKLLAQVHLTNRRYWLPEVSHTFHGRDIFSPVGAHIACGVPLAALGEPIDSLQRLSLWEPQVHQDGAISGHVLHVDRFGNVITNIPSHLLGGRSDWVIHLAGHRITEIQSSYAAVKEGELLAIIDSSDHLELAVRNGSAAQATGAQVGDPVEVMPPERG